MPHQKTPLTTCSKIRPEYGKGATEKHLGKKLWVKQSGGTAGGGSQLTPLAEYLIEKFGEIQQHIEKETDECFKRVLGPELDIDIQCHKK